jgi:hypothetical protein
MENHALTRRKDKQNREEKVRIVKQYLQERVMPVLEPLQMAIMKERPEDIREFCISFLKIASTLCEM